jgi:hypothetical protein
MKRVPRRAPSWAILALATGLASGAAIPGSTCSTVSDMTDFTEIPPWINPERAAG